MLTLPGKNTSPIHRQQVSIRLSKVLEQELPSQLRGGM